MVNIDVSIDTRGLMCPQPLVETRKKLRKMQRGEVLEVIGDHGTSKKEIPLAMQQTGEEVLLVEDRPDGTWRILIKKGS